MSQRITLVLDDEIVSTARKLQAKRILTSTKSVSFSNIINEMCKESKLK